MVEVGVPPPAGGGIDKRTLLIAAILIGGVAGAFILFSRKSQPSDTTENKAQTSGNDAMSLAYQNLATQLLGFRGDVSVANATLAQGQEDIKAGQGGFTDLLNSLFGTLNPSQQDTLTAIGNESAARAASDTNLNSQLAAWFAQVFSGQTATNAQINSAFTALSGQTNDVFNALAQGQANLGAQTNDEFNALAQGQANLARQANDEFNARQGAGGATPRQAILAAIGAEDDGGQYRAMMSSGPVRQLTNRKY